MPETLTVHNVPTPLYERLRQRAEGHQHSLDAEVVALLEAAMDREEGERQAAIERVKKRRENGPSHP